MSKAGEAAQQAYHDLITVGPGHPGPVTWDLIAQAAIAAHEPDEDIMRRDFERLDRDSYKFKRGMHGGYMNPVVQRDWKWFQLGAIAAAKAVGRQQLPE